MTGRLPIPVVFAGVVLLILVACEVGFRIGHYHRGKRQDKDAPGSIGVTVGGLMNMLVFLLAFTFSLAAGQYDLRKQDVLAEANVIGSAFMRADLMEPTRSAEVKQLLREYVDIRLGIVHGGDPKTALAQSEEIHRQLWRQASQAAADKPGAPTSAMAQSVIDVVAMHQKRATAGLHSRIPLSVWIGLLAITFLAMLTLGIQVGLHGERRLVAAFPFPFPLSMAFAVLFTLVVDLDRPQSGFITVSQDAMVDLQRTMNR
jgi:hypothetical protein